MHKTYIATCGTGGLSVGTDGWAASNESDLWFTCRCLLGQILFKPSSTHSILPHGSYFLVLRVIETIFDPSTPSRPNIAAGTSQSTNFRLTQRQITLKRILMGMVYWLSQCEVTWETGREATSSQLDANTHRRRKQSRSLVFQNGSKISLAGAAISIIFVATKHVFCR